METERQAITHPALRDVESQSVRVDFEVPKTIDFKTSIQQLRPFQQTPQPGYPFVLPSTAGQ
jgi:hypothetical protein